MSLILDKINYVYSEGTAYQIQALKDVNLEIKDGQFIGVIGHTGSGKSTLIRLVNGLETADSGKVTVCGKELSTLKKPELRALRRKIGMVFQSYELFPHLTVLDNILLAPMKVQKRNKEEVKKEAEQLLDRVGLLDKKDNYPRQLSGGQKQRISIARVFLKNPPILILDEATSALDNESERWIQHSLEELSKNRTTITIAHRLSTIKNADEIIVITENGIAERGTHETLLEKNGIYAGYYNMA